MSKDGLAFFSRPASRRAGYATQKAGGGVWQVRLLKIRVAYCAREELGPLESTTASLDVARSVKTFTALALRAPDRHRLQRGLFHRLTELLLLRALAHDHGGVRTLATDDLVKALTVAAPMKYLRLFLDDAKALRPLVDRLEPDRLRGSEAAPLARRLQQLMRSTDDSATERRNGPVPAVDELTKREISILKRLESGLSNKEIAESIFISEGTLKWHLHNVYGKLDVKNRAGAMMRARGMGLL